MLASHRYEGKNKEELLNLCLKELNVSENELYYSFKESEAGLFKTKKYFLAAISKEEIIDYLKNFILSFSNI